MMCFKDMTFCHDWCDNTNCGRNYSHIVEAKKEGGFLFNNDWMPVCFFVNVPIDCGDFIPKQNENTDF